MNFRNLQPPPILDLSTLPTLPQTLIELIEACNDNEIDIYSVGALVAKDATISARILQLANSAFLGTKAAFVEIEQAVIYLGIDTVRNMAVSVSVYEAFNSERKQRVVNMPQFWYHSLLTAILAKTLAEATNYASPAEAYLAGLLHDLGKLLLAANFPEQYTRLLSNHSEPQQLTEQERHDLGISHAEASGMLVRHWHLQEAIADAIEGHHTNLRPRNDFSLSDIIRLANILSLASPDSHDYAAYTSQGPLDATVLETCCRQATAVVEDIAGAMGITVERDSQTTDTKKADSASRELQEKVGSVTAIFGALDNLLKAENQDRICRILEETLQILCNIRHCFLLLPTEHPGTYRIALSKSNPLYPRITDIPVPEDDASSIIQRCKDEAVVCYISRQDDGADISPADSKLISFLGCVALLAVPVPIADTNGGILLAGLSQRQLQLLKQTTESIQLLAAHGGARLHLEQLNRKKAAELARRELAGVENVARSIAHEISNPLAIIQNYLAILERKIADNADTTYDFQIISDEIGRINAIARQLENISDLTSAQPMNTARLDHLLKDVLTLFRESVFQQRKIEVAIRLQPDTRSLALPADILHQVLTILFANAADALPAGGKIVVSSSLEQPVDNIARNILRISVGDTGPGVPTPMIESIFNAGITTKDSRHLGLGLSIARKLLVNCGGNILYEHSTDHGACFVIEIPADEQLSDC